MMKKNFVEDMVKSNKLPMIISSESRIVLSRDVIDIMINVEGDCNGSVIFMIA